MKIITPKLPSDCRIITVSDIHGNLRHFQMLLEKCGYSPNDDYLFILGDIVEKGRDSLAALRFVQRLCQNEKTVLILGNNDTMCHRMAFHDTKEYFLERIKQRPHNTYLEMAESLGIDSFETDFEQKRQRVNKHFEKELDFIKNLPLAIETEDFIFIHAGIENRPDWRNTSEKFALTEPWFLEKEHQADKTVICGHYPTYNYKAANNTNLPLIDEEKRIIGIDGGASTKWAGQLNALIINYTEGKYVFETV
ncbi:MAG: metallophosphoesterase, partial [Firmicutes bacterium]|nr:metallophosphoesterase [Bacillota bacterium]